MKRLPIILLFLLVSACGYADQNSFADVQIQVVKEETGKPIRNAAVILHVVNSKGKEEGGLNLKTDAEGNASYNGIPFGRLRIQVVVSGRKTFGQDYEINQASHKFVVKLKPPQEQYSIYDEHPDRSPRRKTSERYWPSLPGVRGARHLRLSDGSVRAVD